MKMHALLRTRHIVNKRYNVLNRCQSCHNCIHCVSVSKIHTIYNSKTWNNNNVWSSRPDIDNILSLEKHNKNYYVNTNCNLLQVRNFSLSNKYFDKAPLKPSSQVEVTVEELKKQKKTPATVPATAVKKSIKERVLDEIMHYYHGFRLLFIDIKITCGLIWRVINGHTLTRREYRLLTRTVGDMFRLVPFSVFIIVPFAELLLPVVLKFFPGMLPTTFHTTAAKESKLKQSLKMKMEMAKFLQQTLDAMAVQHKDRSSDQVKEFMAWFHKIRTSGEQITTEDIIKYSKLFEDEITLDSLSRSQLVALCRVLEVQTLGTNNFLRFQLRMKLRLLAADDQMIQKEGVASLLLSEIQQACRARGMRAYGVSEARLRSQLEQWLDLSLNKRVPPSLLLLSRALMLPETIPTEDKLKATISALPETVLARTSAALAEKEGKILNKVKLQILKEEERKVKEERLEINAEKKKAEIKEELIDTAPIITEVQTPAMEEQAKIIAEAKSTEDAKIATKDLEAIEDAVTAISKEKLLVEKEVLSDLKAEMADYNEDVQDFKKAVADMPKQELKVSSASKMLFNKVNRMIRKMDAMVTQLEKQKLQLEDKEGVEKERLLKITDIVDAIKKIQNVDNEGRLEQIKRVLMKMDDDCDGSINVEDVLKVIEFIGKDSVKLSDKQVDELLELLDKEEILEVEDKIEKALKKEKQVQITKDGEKAAAAAAATAAKEDGEKMEVSETSKSTVPKSKVASSIGGPITSIEQTKKKSDTKML